MKITDIADMPGFNVNGPQNGIRSVSEGRITIDYRKLLTVVCVEHGACLCVASSESGRLYRCATCNQGAWRPR